MKFLIAALFFALTACGHQPTKPEIQTVYVKVKEPCIAKAPARPAYQFGKGSRPAGKAMARMLASDFEAAEKYGSDWEAAAAGCFIAEEAQGQSDSSHNAESRTPDAE